MESGKIRIPVYGSGGIMRYADGYLYDQESILIPRKGTLSNLFFLNEPLTTFKERILTDQNWCSLIWGRIGRNETLHN